MLNRIVSLPDVELALVMAAASDPSPSAAAVVTDKAGQQMPVFQQFKRPYCSSAASVAELLTNEQPRVRRARPRRAIPCCSPRPIEANSSQMHATHDVPRPSAVMTMTPAQTPTPVAQGLYSVTARRGVSTIRDAESRIAWASRERRCYGILTCASERRATPSPSPRREKVAEGRMRGQRRKPTDASPPDDVLRPRLARMCGMVPWSLRRMSSSRIRPYRGFPSSPHPPCGHRLPGGERGCALRSASSP